MARKVSHKVYQVKGPVEVPNHDYERTVLEVAEDIEAVYNDVAVLSGKVIAGHTCTVSVLASENSPVQKQTPAEYLFLVAEFPKDPGPPLDGE